MVELETLKGIKDLYLCRFNYQHEIYVERVMAFSERQAWVIVCKRIAKKVDRDPHSIMGLYGGQRDNFKIVKEIEFIEQEERGE